MAVHVRKSQHLGQDQEDYKFKASLGSMVTCLKNKIKLKLTIQSLQGQFCMGMKPGLLTLLRVHAATQHPHLPDEGQAKPGFMAPPASSWQYLYRSQLDDHLQTLFRKPHGEL